MNILRDVWRLFLHDRGFAGSLLAVFIAAGVFKFIFLASWPIVLSVIGLGCFTALISAKPPGNKED